ncbi:MAG: hypothetical protein P8N31_01650 [Planctomycetota bacterium]|nr:hypothetical protein [Planctomycetota bacterium]MDG2142237.1 hypothetical protein [Planctomycetota bacterium]
MSFEFATLLLIIMLSLLVVRAGAVALTMTGLSLDAARFQSLSAFSGVGFTTSESEAIVGHAARRRIISLLMLLGNAGLFSALGALIVGLGADRTDDTFRSIVFLILGCVVLLFLSKVRFLNHILNALLQKLFVGLRELAMISEGVLVLSVLRASGETLATPGPHTSLQAEDVLLCYGREEDLKTLSSRPGGGTGNACHQEAVERQRLFRAKESAEDPHSA